MTTKEKYVYPKGPLNKEELAKFKIIFDALENDSQAYDFLTPVDYAGKFFYKYFLGLGLDDYPTIIKNPMDVSTIKVS